MNVISEKFANELTDKEMREAYLAAQTRTKIANQIRAIRNQRGWSQEEFAKLTQKPQSNISRLESREYGNYTLKTLLDLAAAFDVGLAVEFVSYEQFLIRTQDLRPEALEVPIFQLNALQSLCRGESPQTVTLGQYPNGILKGDDSRARPAKTPSVWDAFEAAGLNTDQRSIASGHASDIAASANAALLNEMIYSSQGSASGDNSPPFVKSQGHIIPDGLLSESPTMPVQTGHRMDLPFRVDNHDWPSANLKTLSVHTSRAGSMP